MKKNIKQLFERNRIKSPPADARFTSDIERQSVIIHHYCPHTYNAGDHFVIRSIRNHIMEHIPQAVFVPKPCAVNRGWGSPFRLTGRNLENSNEYADAVIVGGSDQYKGWSLRIKKGEIERLVPPLYFIGLGASSTDIDKPAEIDAKFYNDIRAAHSQLKLASVRDHATERFLNGIGIDNVEVTGCPATYLFDEPFEYREKAEVLLTFPFPVLKDDSPKMKIVMEMLNRLMAYMKRNKIKYTIVCQDDRDLYRAQKLLPEEKFFFSNYVEDYYSLYRSAGLVVGTRLHASIISAGLGTPFININLDMRGQAFSETFQLQDWNVDYNERNVYGKLIKRVNYVTEGDVSRFEEFYKLKSQYKAIFLKHIENVSQDIMSRL